LCSGSGPRGKWRALGAGGTDSCTPTPGTTA
jgi:hypothetical protein